MAITLNPRYPTFLCLFYMHDQSTGNNRAYLSPEVFRRLLSSVSTLCVRKNWIFWKVSDFLSRCGGFWAKEALISLLSSNVDKRSGTNCTHDTYYGLNTNLTNPVFEEAQYKWSHVDPVKWSEYQTF